jgi:hypothetical protein
MFYELPQGSRIPSKKRLPVGSIFTLNGRVYRRGPTRIYRGDRGGMDPTVCRAFYARQKRRKARGVEFFPYGAELKPVGR